MAKRVHSTEQIARAEQYVRDQLAVCGRDISEIGSLRFDQIVRDVLKHVPIVERTAAKERE